MVAGSAGLGKATGEETLTRRSDWLIEVSAIAARDVKRPLTGGSWGPRQVTGRDLLGIEQYARAYLRPLAAIMLAPASRACIVEK